MELKPGYKQTEAGVIPEEWGLVPFSELFEFRNGVNAEKDAYGHGMPFINVLEVITKGHLRAVDITGRVALSKAAIDSFAVHRGDLVFNRTSETQEEVGLASVYLDDEPVVFGGFVIRGRPRRGLLDPSYSGYALRAQVIRTQVVAKGQGAIHANVGQADLGRVYAPIPPLSEQRAIAAALSDVDALIGALDRLIAKKRDLKQAAMQQLLTGQTRLLGFGGTDRRYRQTDLGVIPEEWGLTKIRDAASIKTGKRNTQDRIDDGQYPFFVRSQSVERIDSYSFDGEAVLTAGDGVGTGKVFHYIKGKFDFHQRVYKISDFSAPLNGFYFFLYFSSRFYDRIMAMTAKSSVDSVRLETIAGMLIPLPSTDEQAAIAEIVSDMDAEIVALEQRRDKTRALKQGMMQELLTGRTRLV
jgi:type I restriction enzyme S subunit